MKLQYYLQQGAPLTHGFRQDRVSSFDTLFRDLDGNYERCKSIADADIVVWTGGEDVTPALYGQSAHPTTHFNTARDFNDMMAFRFSGRAKLRIGICRGAQFLNVMSGGSMYQHHVGSKAHPKGHGKSHKVFRYTYNNLNDLEDTSIDDCLTYTVTSTHHQIMKPGPKARLLGVATTDDYDSQSLCRAKMVGGQLDGPGHGTSIIIPDYCFDDELSDPEMLWYPETRSLCIQGHPEYDDATEEFVEDMQTMIEEVLESCAA